MSVEQMYSPGLEGVIAGETEVACVDQGKLLYRGYPIADLAEHATFEEVAHLLLYGELPDQMQLHVIQAAFETYQPLAHPVVEALRLIPDRVPLMDVLRSTVSMAGHFDPVPGDEPQHLRQRAVWLTAQVAGIIAARYRLLNGQEPLTPLCGLSHAAQLLYLAHGEPPDELSAHLLDLTLILYAEHEFNASTFTARVIGSTLSDMTSAVVGAIGALKGPLHGGANEKSMEMLMRFSSAGEASEWIRTALAQKQKVMGFGHRVYKHGDHRAHILERELRLLAKQKNAENLMAIYDAIKDPMVNEKKIFPNVDYPCGLVYYLLGLPLDLYTPLFVAARVTGWCAHYLEQRQDNRIYRPLSRYTGSPERSVPPLDGRF
ncbi:MAG: citrate/2-methylcitrate synthase [FCB group bacterium]|jgi:citrate synthase|nr:citrate/2-methylcitrate synthase [FCB group bacterium]